VQRLRRGGRGHRRRRSDEPEVNLINQFSAVS
jgi:hypothetical protein